MSLSNFSAPGLTQQVIQKSIAANKFLAKSRSFLIVLSILLLGHPQAIYAQISEAVKHLETPDIKSAKEAARLLDAISSEKSNPEAQTAKTLSGLIKAAFTAESKVQQEANKLKDEFNNAKELERQGNEYLKPNALGSTNEMVAEAKFKQAREARSNALQKVVSANSTLGIMLSNLSVKSKSLKITQTECEILLQTAKAIESRTFKPTEILCGQMEKNAEQAIVQLEADAVEKQYAEWQYRALAAMRKAIETRKPKDEAYAMELLVKYAPDTAKTYTDYLAAKEAGKANNDLEHSTFILEQKLKEMDRRLNRAGLPSW